MSEDPFGDDSFLDDFDVDSAIAKRPQTLTPSAAIPDEKRRKISSSPTATPSLEETLTKYFGYPAFRGGQKQVIETILQGRDVSVFWATGAGKSLCYQIPALHTNKVSIIVGPLISLMQDQVHKLNTLNEETLATYLGSAQTDSNAIRGALRGDYPCVYLTPEKLPTMIWQLAQMADKIGLFAIDEAHCVSEWGFDFRPDYRSIGKLLREHAILSTIPILTLTATAVPRVQADIGRCLQLRNPLIHKQSFDRSNLEITVRRKTSLPNAMKELVDIFQSPHVTGQSTIVYCATRSQVEEVAQYLRDQTRASVAAYHAGLPQQIRDQAHLDFLTSKAQVCVASVAYGMGIDKIDTRRVIHYGPPKTMEEYYQQIGRGGRDGLKAFVTMYMTDSDFDKYQSDFYLGKLQGPALTAAKSSIAALRKYSLDSETCRRKALLDFFSETPLFGDRCGTCDTCKAVKKYGTDAKRDFSSLGARVVLLAVKCLDNQGQTTILKVISGGTVEDYRYAYGETPGSVSQSIEKEKEKMERKRPQQFYRDLIGPLVQKALLIQETQSNVVKGYNRTWTTYKLSPEGALVLRDSHAIILPVPESVREQERIEEEKRQKVLAQLERNGLQVDKLPQKEVERGDGEVIRSYSKWYSYVESHKAAGREERVNQLEQLMAHIESWRTETAMLQRTAPAAVLSEHLVASLAYAAASMAPGLKMEKAALEAAGVRTRHVQGLVDLLGEWVERYQPASTTGAQLEEQAMVLGVVNPGKSWQYAVYRPQKKTGLAVWEASFVRFAAGESPQTIALSPSDGRKPIQVNTVVGHLFDAIINGKSVDTSRLAPFHPPPSKNEWEELLAAEQTTGMDVVGDPSNSGKNGDKFTMSDFLRPIVGESIVDTPPAERSQSDRELFGNWCNKLKWFMALRRVGYEPTFSAE